MRREFSDTGQDDREFFSHDYLGDVWSWTEMMMHLMNKNRWLGHQVARRRVRIEPTLLLKQVVAPIVNELSLLIQGRGFDVDRIERRGFYAIPKLFVSRSEFQQVCFNLLSNAIKYAHDDPKKFRITIRAGSTVEWYRLLFRDWGSGIPEGFEASVFERGVRGPNAVKTDVTGQGLGLWIARLVVERHGGTLTLTQRINPTEFTISLPTYLSRHGPT